MINVLDQVIDNDYALYNGDSVEILKALPENSIDYCIYSPPFADLYVFSDSENDMGNSTNHDQFFTHYSFLLNELYRVIKPGRLVSFHCMDLPSSKERDGYIGTKDFSGDLIRSHQKEGFIYHSKVTIWKDPLLAAVRTKAIGLMYKQLCKDSSISRQGIPDYLITMRKPGENKEFIKHEKDIGLGQYVGNPSNAPKCSKDKYAHAVWQKYASPIWTDIRATNVLKYTTAKDKDDEKHICPLQLDVINRALVLWSNENDIVLSPFMGIGSEGYVSLQLNRRFVGCELKKSYFDIAKKNLAECINKQGFFF